MDMLNEFLRITNKNGRIVILTARKQEFEDAINKVKKLFVMDSMNILVNGKKANVYKVGVKNTASS